MKSPLKSSGLSDIAIRNPVFTWMIMASLILFGGISFSRMGVSQLPDVDFPNVNISYALEGAAPEVMETTVVDPVEDVLMSIAGIENISSTARSGSASINLEFDLNKNIDVAVQEVQTALGRAQRRLPADVEPAVITKSNPEDQPIMWLGVSTDRMETPEFMAYVRDHLKDKFSTVPGVTEVFLGGYVDPALRVWISAKKLNQYSLTVDDVLNTISTESVELPSGRIETHEKEINVRTLGEANTAEGFRKLVISRRGGGANYNPITLGQVTIVEDGLSDIRRKSRIMGKPAIGLGIRKQRGSNAVGVGDAVLKRMEEVKKQLPEGMQIGVNFDGTKFIRESVRELNMTLLEAGLLTALVCWLFLGSWTATLNVILAIPTSIVGTFIILYALGFTLNTFTLLGLSLAIGIVVDDAIMVLENIVRHRELGKSKLESATIGAREIYFAALSATVAIIAIFLPVAFMKGLIGKYFFEFGITISVAVALSLLEALTLTPMRCSQFLKVEHRTTRIGRFVENAFQSLAASYQKLLPFLLRHRVVTLLLALVVFLASLPIAKFLSKEFVPPQDQGTLMVRLQAPEGSSLDYTDAKVMELEKILSSKPEVERYFVSVGGFGGGQVNTAMAFITLKPKNKRTISQQDLAEVLRAEFKNIKGARVFVQDPSLSGFGGGRSFPVDVSLRGPDWTKLGELSTQMKEEMEKTGIMVDVDSDFRSGMPEVQVIPDREKARLYGVSFMDINKTINSLIGGSLAGQFSRDGRRYDVRVRLLADERDETTSITRLFVRNNRGELIPLSSIVKIEEKTSLQSVSRKNRERAISVYSNLKPGTSQTDAITKVQEIANRILPKEYNIVVGGSSQTFQESMQSLIFALVLGLLVSYMVLASQFNSFIDPITVLLALPFSVTGAFIFLLIGGQSINIYSMIGIILLMGIVKKNSILLVDFTNQARDQGKDIHHALIDACPTRLRPILMTSFATIAGALPAALSLGAGAETRVPMAMSVIGGVLVSTFLTLLVVPCFYSLVSPKHRRQIQLD
ncbi:MAG: efflux RND transporter permease subunit [Bdellovibrionales bacterium]